jgi:hypothetical protein
MLILTTSELSVQVTPNLIMTYARTSRPPICHSNLARELSPQKHSGSSLGSAEPVEHSCLVENEVRIR